MWLVPERIEQKHAILKEKELDRKLSSFINEGNYIIRRDYYKFGWKVRPPNLFLKCFRKGRNVKLSNHRLRVGKGCTRSFTIPVQVPAIETCFMSIDEIARIFSKSKSLRRGGEIGIFPKSRGLCRGESLEFGPRAYIEGGVRNFSQVPEPRKKLEILLGSRAHNI